MKRIDLHFGAIPQTATRNLGGRPVAGSAFALGCLNGKKTFFFFFFFSFHFLALTSVYPISTTKTTAVAAAANETPPDLLLSVTGADLLILDWFLF